CQFGWDWGPRFVTAGIWREIFLEGWESNRIESVFVTQSHTTDNVELTFAPELARADANAKFRATVSYNGEVVSTAEGGFENLKAIIANPQLWWSSGHGAQPLYEVQVELLGADRVLSSWTRHIGLRTIELDMNPDEYEVLNDEGRAL